MKEKFVSKKIKVKESHFQMKIQGIFFFFARGNKRKLKEHLKGILQTNRNSSQLKP